jgi:peptidoglycan/xylan/chitin deacetylase (PgdA/CDA1 family)
MLSHHDIRGISLPPRTVSLTYDDGPGPSTEELGHYLFSNGIAACFFVMGRHAEQYPAVLRRLHGWRHILGNHTYSHCGLVDLALAGGNVVEEIAATDAIIKPYTGGTRIFLRPPYGSWRQQSRPNGPQDFRTSIVADLLNASGRFAHYIGPINWDIVGEDWDCWRHDQSPEECARRYIRAAESAGRGIILMHDSSEEEEQQPKNRTLELTKLLVPALMERGFRFARLDAVLEVRALG